MWDFWLLGIFGLVALTRRKGWTFGWFSFLVWSGLGLFIVVVGGYDAWELELGS